jgi:hypothetical protein
MKVEISKSTTKLHSPVSFGGGCDINNDGDCWDEMRGVLDTVAVSAGIGATYSGAIGNIPLAVTIGGIGVVAVTGSYVANIADNW